VSTPRGPQNLSLLPLTVNLAIYAGDDVELAITVADAQGLPADLTGAVIRSQIRVTPESETVLAPFTPAVDQPASIVRLRLTPVQTSGLPARVVWDCFLDQAGWTTALAAGAISVTRNVTR